MYIWRNARAHVIAVRVLRLVVTSVAPFGMRVIFMRRIRVCVAYVVVVGVIALVPDVVCNVCAGSTRVDVVYAHGGMHIYAWARCGYGPTSNNGE